MTQRFFGRPLKNVAVAPSENPATAFFAAPGFFHRGRCPLLTSDFFACRSKILLSPPKEKANDAIRPFAGTRGRYVRPEGGAVDAIWLFAGTESGVSIFPKRKRPLLFGDSRKALKPSDIWGLPCGRLSDPEAPVRFCRRLHLFGRPSGILAPETE